MKIISGGIGSGKTTRLLEELNQKEDQKFAVYMQTELSFWREKYPRITFFSNFSEIKDQKFDGIFIDSVNNLFHSILAHNNILSNVQGFTVYPSQLVEPHIEYKNMDEINFIEKKNRKG